jgi:hypothetical protein
MPHRPNVVLPPPKHIIHTRDHQHTPKHDNAPVYAREVCRVDDGKETRDASHCHVEDSEDVDGYAEFSEREAGGWEGFASDAFLEDA